MAETAIELAAGRQDWSERQQTCRLLAARPRVCGSSRPEIGYRAPFRRRVLDLILRWPQSFYLIGIEVLTL